jgi:deazaflavin-dependent oxidoreductase (nitroreductase family)
MVAAYPRGVIPPRWFLRVGWALHRGVFALSGGRVGTDQPRHGRPGTLFLVTIGRRSGRSRQNAVFYLEDGPNLVVVASNAGADGDPGWWLNLQARPDAAVRLGTAVREVRARAATPAETARLWQPLVDSFAGFEEYRRTAARPIPVVILEPR